MMKKISVISSILVLMLVAIGAVTMGQDSPQSPEDMFVGTVAAPEFPAGLDWINVDQPLTMAGLQGKIVVLDFWTYGCINCMHMIPVLEKIEDKFGQEVVVIGVHSAKFENEGQTDNLRQIVQRYDLHHPVINDNQFAVWGAYGANAWPTIAIVDPRGNIVARDAGEIPFEAFDQYLTGMIAYYDGLGTDEIDRTPLEIALEGAGDPGTPLLYPGKVLVDEASNRLFIADSNHNRVVIVDLSNNEVTDIIGTGARGFDDGDFDTATFNKLQGITLDGDKLYIADVNNHAIRVADLTDRSVSTLIGTGKMGRGITQPGAVWDDPLSLDIRSPWDVEIGDGGILHIAMAGTHQLFIYDLVKNTLAVSVGDGREANANAALSTSELAQPSGLYYAGDGKLYFADSESSTVRLADFKDNFVQVIAGTTQNNLFDFGDVDGELGENRLQHALDVEGTPDGDIYIADTYNSRIKLIRAGETALSTAFGLGGTGGYADGGADVAQFDEPGGMSYADGKLYVADTNNQVIRVIDLETQTVSTLQFSNPEKLVIDPSSVTILGGNSAQDTTITLDAQTIATGEGDVSLHITLPDGFKINDLIESHLVLSSDTDAVQIDTANVIVADKELTIPVTFVDGEGQLDADLTLYYCRTGEEGLCFIDMVKYVVPVTVSNSADNKIIALERDVVAPNLDA